MGNREDLLAGATRCLFEKGYSRTTARDVANAAGVSLAAIGYHFGSKEVLLNTAMIEAIGGWGDAVERAVAEAVPADASPRERFVATWDCVRSTLVEYHGLWAAQFEAVARLDDMPEIRQSFQAVQRHARLAMSAMFTELTEVPDTEDEVVVGAFHQAVLAGLVTQWLIDPEQALTGAQVLRGLELTGARVLG
ncbi:TetR/AcrR family transcriptional regulator [Kitasatospora sp. NPDC002040]|uniref:TetR/AcrR family transcriptional regulator n=1 Tax=Kitasatospora sp. NPDC002040 TaxID=3154661 RepID=UPI0033346227